MRFYGARANGLLTVSLTTTGGIMRVKYNMDTQLVFQIGYPLKNILAAFVHNRVYELANLNAICTLVEVKKGELGKFVEAVKTIGGNGFDITMPHKGDVIPFLDECDEVAKAFKSVNHVKIVNGKLIGCGLDGMGMGLALQAKLGSLEGRKALIIGAGAVSGPVAAAVCERGVKDFVIVNRTVEKADEMGETLKKLYGKDIKVKTGPLTDDFMCSVAGDRTLCIQCTSLGMVGNPNKFETLNFLSKLKPGCFVADVLYPNTDYLVEARRLGLPTLDGKGMLLHQQLAAIEFRFGVKMSLDTLPEIEEAIDIAIAMREARQRREAVAEK